MDKLNLIIFIKIQFTIIALFLTFFMNNAEAQSNHVEQVIYDMVEEVSQDNLSEYIQEFEQAGGTYNRIAFTSGVENASFYLHEQFDAIDGLDAVVYDTFYVSNAVSPYDEEPQVNVVATIEGETNPEQSYVIGAHIDATADRDEDWGHLGANWEDIEAPGADDNGTGLAAILEMARILTDPEFDFNPDYTIKLVGFGAEERLPGVIYTGTGTPSNHHGSTHYAQQARANGEDILGMVSVDMIGYNNEFDYNAIVYSSQAPSLDQQSVSFGREFYDTNNEFSIGLIMNDPPFATGNYSDHRSFAVEDYPAILMIENAAPWNRNDYYEPNPYYHKSSDTYDKLNMGLVKKVTQLNLATVASLGQQATSANEEIKSEKPEGYSLFQNYPNPFNPSTSIEFNLPESGFVSIKVFDMLGREVATLVNETMDAGNHTVEFSTDNINRELSSGVYIYQLETEHFVQSKNMLLVK